MAEAARSPERGEAGFSLVEVLVGLALVALLSSLLLQGVWTATRVARLLAAAERQEGVQAARAHVRHALEDAVGAVSGDRHAVFAGRSDGVLLVTPAERLVETGGQMRVELAAMPGLRGLDLLERRGLDRGVSAEPAAPEPLLRGLAGLRLRYFGRRGPTPLATWGDAWTIPGRLPILVSVEVAFPAGDGRRWAPLFVPVAAGL
ncbi:prepilin-type N-terminal cleavage/methylation domain-containing protein [Methylobacterium durans]|uniref:prepilin-type N-terminal cleavage/methylation domain-containing protein n=1 Tax=Methylobacterium durans TaxID=2202825 RepID=UPI002AFF7A24|nr:prepilin-type N-terminal cleavage/methylation domain-containing protein [Methylobacterium durans]MEA1832118.1 prepilin-type N-terminal cleavage/methylation domain-containing protein [Methylobacterium durans]